MSWLRWINYRGFWRLIFFAVLFIYFPLMILQPDDIAEALRISPTETPQIVSNSLTTLTPTITPEPEELGQVGENAGLVCGAVILVIIIIAGLVRGARWMSYRGDSGKDAAE